MEVEVRVGNDGGSSGGCGRKRSSSRKYNEGHLLAGGNPGNSFGERTVKPDCPEINSGLTVWHFQSATTYLKVRRSLNGRCPQNDTV